MTSSEDLDSREFLIKCLGELIGEVESDDIGEITYDPVIKKCKFTLFARYYPPEEQLKAMGVQGIEILGIKQSEDKFVISCQIDMVL